MTRPVSPLVARLALLSGLVVGIGAPPRLLAQRAPRAGNGPANRAPAAQGTPRAIWRGQDGQDRVGPSTKPGPNEIQDIHVRLEGLGDRPIRRVALQGLGGDSWSSDGEGGWYIDVERPRGGPVADLYFEPARKEDGRGIECKIWFEDGTEASFWTSGKADPNKRVAGASLQAEWGGQGPADRVGVGPSVGPDGIRDAKIVLKRLSDRRGVRSVRIDGPGGLAWESGKNPGGLPSAEFRADTKDRTTGAVFFQPAKSFSTAKLDITVTYDDDSTDKTGLKIDRFDPKLATPAPAPFTLLTATIRARWLGQDGEAPGIAGDVHVMLENLPGGRSVRAIALSDSLGGRWSWQERETPRYQPEPYALPIRIRRGPEANAVHLAFPPIGDETGLKLSARLIFDDGRSAVVAIDGGTCDPSKRSPRPGDATVSAKPGDDLQKLVGSAGTVRLAAGTYDLDQTLRLANPVQLIGEPGSILRFRQSAQAEPWTAAIKIHRGNTRLEGFAVRFAGPVRWKPDVQYGPAVIGTPDNFDQGNDDPKAGIVLAKLDLESPPASKPDAYEEAIGLVRFVTGSSGRIEQCTLKGGMIQVAQGPWEILDNEYRGTHPGTFSWSVISTLASHQVRVKGNKTRAEAPCGKTWRFLVQSRGGVLDEIAENRVEGIGPRDEDKREDNAPEILLTESYRLKYAGRAAALSGDGRILQVAEPQGEPVGSGDVVAVLSGPNAGEWARITHAIEPTTFVVDPPLPREAKIVSIANGFVNQTYRRNVVDTRGSTIACNLVLAGNQYGVRVLDNHFLGSGGFKITAAPSEEPVHWGWSHAPCLGAVISGNILEDQARFASLGVERDGPVKTSRDRVYFTATLKDNRLVWTGPPPRDARGRGDRVGLVVNTSEPLDPAETQVTESGTTVTGGPARIEIGGAIWNGKAIRAGSIAIPKAGSVADGSSRSVR